MKRFTAELVFRYGVKGWRRRRVLCESRLIRVDARSARAALAAARRYGKRVSMSYTNPNGDVYAIEFLGVADLEQLWLREEVWHWMFETLKPRGRLKPASRFRVFLKGGVVGDAWEAVPRELTNTSLLKPLRSRPRKRRKKVPVRGRRAGA